MKRLPKIFNGIMDKFHIDIPDELWASFQRELLEDNFFRLSVVSVVLFLIELILFFLQEYLFHTGIIILSFLTVSLVLIPLIFHIRKRIDTVGSVYALAVMYIYSLSVLIFGASLALAVLHEIDVTHVYLMTVLGISLFLYIRPFPLTVLYAVVYIGFALTLPYFGAANTSLLTLRINTLVFNLFAWLLGQMSLRSRAAVYVSRFQLREQNRILEDLSQRDAMTGLYHHSASLSLLEDEIEYARRTGCPLSLIMTDIDDFKHINDTYGHQFGDDVISRTAAVLTSVAGGNSIVGRYGGEEFIIILPGADLDMARLFAGQIMSAMEAAISHPRVTLSGGISHYQGESLNEFVHLTDERLYQAKRNGKCRFICTRNHLLQKPYTSATDNMI